MEQSRLGDGKMDVSPLHLELPPFEGTEGKSSVGQHSGDPVGQGHHQGLVRLVDDEHLVGPEAVEPG